MDEYDGPFLGTIPIDIDEQLDDTDIDGVVGGARPITIDELIEMPQPAVVVTVHSPYITEVVTDGTCTLREAVEQLLDALDIS